jgi:hypothetical protein
MSVLKNQDIEHLFEYELKAIHESADDDSTEIMDIDNLKWKEAFIHWTEFLDGDGSQYSYQEIYDFVKLCKISIATSVPKKGKESGLYSIENYGAKNIINFFKDYDVYIERRSLSDLNDHDCLYNAQTHCKFIKNGEYYDINYAKHEFKLKSTKGLDYLHYLIKNKMESYTPEDLYYEINPRESAEESSSSNAIAAIQNEELSLISESRLADEYIDSKAKDEYLQAVKSIEEELVEARQNNDNGKIEQLEAKKIFYIRELQNNKFAAKVHHPCRQKVGKALKDALKKIGNNDEQLARHLKKSLTRLSGTNHKYEPNPDLDWITE